jgi:hypothetical protein
MKANQIIEKLSENWPAKVVCFVIAIFLYMFYQIATLDKKSFTVPLTITAKAGVVPSGDYPSHVKISVRGHPEDIATIKKNDLSAYLDLNNCSKDGTVKLPVLVKLSAQAMLIDPLEVRVSPESVTLDVEEQIAGFAPVSALIQGEPAHGYQAGSITVEPSQVEITGPRSLVENCTRLQTAPVSLQDAVSPVTMSVPVENTGSFLSLTEVNEVSVTVSIIPIQTTKSFPSMTVRLIHIPAQFELDGDAPVLDITLTGSMLDLESYIPGAFVVTADCSHVEQTGSYDIPLTFAIPDNLMIDSSTERTITVNFKAGKDDNHGQDTKTKNEKSELIIHFGTYSENGEA